MANALRDRLRHHVTGAIERGEAEAITEHPRPDLGQFGYLKLFNADGKPDGLTTVYPLNDSLRRLAREHSGRSGGNVELIRAEHDGKRWQPAGVVAQYRNGSLVELANA